MALEEYPAPIKYKELEGFLTQEEQQALEEKELAEK